ncbi:hypothetical protein CC80DRAFT_236252 [Byssothecium circinans]|uniref:Uncharacterized protein n=1 Tax=Byssothecium circinans TaxID=147558 RepID=A0A6A5UC53_9PLEO|nr:hypothetical protein CC80DRAFT_236252 [Byssothecium circinans]
MGTRFSKPFHQTRIDITSSAKAREIDSDHLQPLCSRTDRRPTTCHSSVIAPMTHHEIMMRACAYRFLPPRRTKSQLAESRLHRLFNAFYSKNTNRRSVCSSVSQIDELSVSFCRAERPQPSQTWTRRRICDAGSSVDQMAARTVAYESDRRNTAARDRGFGRLTFAAARRVQQ